MAVNKFLANEAQVKLEKHEKVARAPFIVYHAFLLCFIIICLLFHAWIGWYAIFFDILFIMIAALLYGPLDFAVLTYYSRIYNGREVTGLEFTEGYRPKIMFRAAFAYGLKFAIIFGCSLFLFVPGIVLGCNYALATIILRKNPKMKIMDALNESSKLMTGHRMEYFGLMLRLVHLFLFGVVTLGVGFVFAMPRAYMSHVVFFRRVIQGDTENLPAEAQPADPTVSSNRVSAAEGSSIDDSALQDYDNIPMDEHDNAQEAETVAAVKVKIPQKPVLERYDEFDKSPEQLALERELLSLVDDEVDAAIEGTVETVAVDDVDFAPLLDAEPMSVVAQEEAAEQMQEAAEQVEIRLEQVQEAAEQVEIRLEQVQGVAEQVEIKIEQVQEMTKKAEEAVQAVQEAQETAERVKSAVKVSDRFQRPSETEDAKKRREERLQELLARREQNKKN